MSNRLNFYEKAKVRFYDDRSSRFFKQIKDITGECLELFHSEKEEWERSLSKQPLHTFLGLTESEYLMYSCFPSKINMIIQSRETGKKET